MSKRPRDDDHYRARETSRRKDEKSYHRESNYERNQYRNDERNHHERNGERNQNRNHNERNDQRNHHERNDKIYDHNKPVDKPTSSITTSSSTSIPTDNKPFIKEKVNFNKSGKLAQDTNMQNGVIVKYSEPIEAAMPTKNWRLYPFKNDESLPFIPIHKKSYFLLGRDRKVVDIPLDHPSVSKQHAVIQYRNVEIERKNGGKFKEIRPYLMDLASSNKTYLDNKEIEPMKYHQLLEKDVIKFGFSTREYVVLIDHDEDE